ncbi:MAG: ABC transporter permease subunit [Candidatus Izemoplasmatales bacterium]
MRIFDSTLFTMELKRGFRGVLIWTFALSASMVLVIALYPMVIDMYAAIPPEFADLMEAFGGIPDSIVEYYATEGAMMLQLFGSIFAALQGFGAINRDEREKTAESLYVLPIARRTFFATKLLRASLEVLILSAVAAASSYVAFLAVGEPIDMAPFLRFTALNALVFLVFVWLAFAMAALLKPNQKPFVAIAVPFVLYVLYTVSLMADDAVLEFLRNLTPFTFADPLEILKADFEVAWIPMTVFLGLSAAGLLAGWRAFRVREIIV